jgi:hypothetical protein
MSVSTEQVYYTSRYVLVPWKKEANGNIEIKIQWHEIKALFFVPAYNIPFQPRFVTVHHDEMFSCGTHSL